MTTTNIFGAPIQDWFSSATSAALANGAASSMMSLAGVGYRWVITDISTMSTQNTVDAIVKILGTGNRHLWVGHAARAGNSDISLNTPIVSDENSHIYIGQSNASAAASVAISGFRQRVPST